MTNRNLVGYLLLTVIWIILITLVVLAFWLPSLIAPDILRWIGHVVLTAIGIALIILLVLSTMANGMRS